MGRRYPGELELRAEGCKGPGEMAKNGRNLPMFRSGKIKAKEEESK